MKLNLRANLDKINHWIHQNPNAVKGILLLLFIPALFSNLSILPLHKDEPIRALVALEMLLRDNFIVPTMNGEFYYKKGPIFNWLIVLFYKSVGINELSTRLPAVLSFITFGLVLFFCLKKYLNKEIAFFSSILFMLTSVVFFITSLYGLIDIFYSLITFLQLFVIFHYSNKEKYYKLFIVSYALMGIGFLTKGLPSIAFQGLTLGIYLIVNKQFKLLFSKYHLVGLGTFAALAGTYYAAYSHYNDLSAFLPTILSESSQRTFLETDKSRTIRHLTTFPFRFLLWAAPATIFLPYLFSKNAITRVWKNPILKFLIITLLANFPVYWASTTTMKNPRYVLMLFPLLITTLTYFYFTYYKEKVKLSFIIFKVMGISTLAASIASLIPIFYPTLSILPYVIPISIATFLALLFLGILILNDRENPLVLFLIAIVIVRIAFNYTIIPSRLEADPWQAQKIHSYKIAELSENTGIYLYGKTHLEEHISFYIEQKQGKILSVSNKADTSSYFIMSTYRYADSLSAANVITVIDTIHDGYYSPVLVKFNSIPTNEATLLQQP